MPILSVDKIIKATGELQASNLWEVKLVPNSKSGVKFADDFMFRCISAGLPTEEISFKETKIARHTIKQPADVERAGEIEFKFIESEDAKGVKIMNMLTSQFLETKGGASVGFSKGWEAVRADAFIYLLNSKGVYTQGYQLYFCTFTPVWPDASLGDSPDPVQVGVKITYNWWDLILGK